MATFVSGAPKVWVVGATLPQADPIREYLAHRGETWNIAIPDDERIDGDPTVVAEAAGRVCYQSWANRRKRSRAEYLRESVIAHGHGSVLEHVWFNCLVADLPRSTQLELVRHGEGTGFSFESQRFTDRHLRFVVPPLLRENMSGWTCFAAHCEEAEAVYHDIVGEVEHQIRTLGLWGDDATLRRKRAKESARAVLPNCVGSDGMVSVNARAARHIIALRSDEHADASIREFAVALFDALAPWAGAFFADAERVPVAFGPDAIRFAHGKV